MFKQVILSVATLTALLVNADNGAAVANVRQVSEHYLQLDNHQRYDELLSVYQTNARFVDPTADVFPGPIGKGPLIGAQAIVAEQKRWGLAEQQFAIDGSFAVGDIVLRHGVLKVRYQDSTQFIPIPFVTIHRIVDGKIAERTDFGEYIQSFGLGDRFTENTKATQDIANRYLQAYLAADLALQRELSAEDIVFQDATAAVFGNGAGQAIVGRAALMQKRQHTFAKVSHFGLQVDHSFVANHHAVFIGTTTYTIAGKTWTQPAVFVFEVKDGKVTRQWDFVDYSVGA